MVPAPPPPRARRVHWSALCSRGGRTPRARHPRDGSAWPARARLPHRGPQPDVDRQTETETAVSARLPSHEWPPEVESADRLPARGRGLGLLFTEQLFSGAPSWPQVRVRAPCGGSARARPVARVGGRAQEGWRVRTSDGEFQERAKFQSAMARSGARHRVPASVPRGAVHAGACARARVSAWAPADPRPRAHCAVRDGGPHPRREQPPRRRLAPRRRAAPAAAARRHPTARPAAGGAGPLCYAAAGAGGTECVRG